MARTYSLPDLTSNAGKVLTVGVSETDVEWATGGGGIAPGTGTSSPVGSVTPSGVGQIYIDTTNDKIYIAYGTANTEWGELNYI